MLHHYVEHRKKSSSAARKYELARAEARAHILEGLKIALDHLDKIIKTIRESKDTDTARLRLMENFKLSRIQAQAILDMRLQQLTGLERKKIEDEYEELIKTIARLKGILARSQEGSGDHSQELKELKEKYGDERRTKITGAAAELEIEDLVAKKTWS